MRIRGVLRIGGSGICQGPEDRITLLSNLLGYKGYNSFVEPGLSAQGATSNRVVCACLYGAGRHDHKRYYSVGGTGNGVLSTGIVRIMGKLSNGTSSLAGRVLRGGGRLSQNHGNCSGRISHCHRVVTSGSGRVGTLIGSLTGTSNAPTRSCVVRRVSGLRRGNRSFRGRLGRLRFLMSRRRLTSVRFSVVRRVVSSFTSAVSSVDMGRGETTVHALVQRVI